MCFLSRKHQLSLHKHVISIPAEVECLMRCSAVIPSTVLLVDSRAEYAVVAGCWRLFFWATGVVVVAHCTVADDSAFYRPDTLMSLFHLTAELALWTKC